MDNRKLRQSAVADFMKSLEHLDELLGDTAEALVLDDGPQGADANGTTASPLNSSQTVTAPNKTQNTNVRHPRR